MAEISVIVVNWNGKHLLDACLSALRQQVFRDFETIFVDNGSEDGSPEYVRLNFPEVRLIVLDENLGFTGGNIAGVRQSNANLIVLLNNDTEAHPNWLSEIHKASVEFPQASSFASKMLLFDEREWIDNCGFALTSAGVTMDLGRSQRDGPDWASTRKVFGACGGAAVYRRDMLEDVGFLDPDFFMVYEDVDLSFRSRLRGGECVFIPSAIVYHRLSATREKNLGQNVFFSQRNIEFVYLKNMPLGLILRSLPERLLYELGGAIYFFKRGAGLAFMRAKLDAIRQLPSLLRKRRVIQRGRTISNEELRALMQRNWMGERCKKVFSAWRRPVEAALQTPGSSS